MTMTTTERPPAPRHTRAAKARRVRSGLLDPKMLWLAVPSALRKLNPLALWRTPIMFVVEVGSVLTTALAISDPSLFAWLIVVWLWLTVLFGNLAALSLAPLTEGLM